MRALVTSKTVEPFNTKKLYNDVLDKFDEYNSKQIAIKHIAKESLSRNVEFGDKVFQQVKSDPTVKATIKSDKLLDFVNDVDSKIDFLKTQFTEDESIIFRYSIQERELDKIIKLRIGKDGRAYDRVKKSCYIKVALCFGLVKLKKDINAENYKSVSMVTQFE